MWISKTTKPYTESQINPIDPPEIRLYSLCYICDTLKHARHIALCYLVSRKANNLTISNPKTPCRQRQQRQFSRRTTNTHQYICCLSTSVADSSLSIFLSFPVNRTPPFAFACAETVTVQERAKERIKRRIIKTRSVYLFETFSVYLSIHTGTSATDKQNEYIHSQSISICVLVSMTHILLQCPSVNDVNVYCYPAEDDLCQNRVQQGARCLEYTCALLWSHSAVNTFHTKQITGFTRVFIWEDIDCYRLLPLYTKRDISIVCQLVVSVRHNKQQIGSLSVSAASVFFLQRDCGYYCLVRFFSN